MLTNRTPEAHAWAVEKFRTFRSEGIFIPFALNKQTVNFPGFDGGAEWGGPAVNPKTGVIYINANEMACDRRSDREGPAGSPGEVSTAANAASATVADRSGRPPLSFPDRINKRLTDEQIIATIHQGKGRMPGFPSLSDMQLGDSSAVPEGERPTGTPQPTSDKQAMTWLRMLRTGQPLSLTAIQLHRVQSLWILIATRPSLRHGER